MGTNVVRLTDRKYMLKLMMRLRQDHESKQEARIQEQKVSATQPSSLSLPRQWC